MLCPLCAAADLLHDCADLRSTYDGQAHPPPGAVGFFCPACEGVIPYRATIRIVYAQGMKSRQRCHNE